MSSVGNFQKRQIDSDTHKAYGFLIQFYKAIFEIEILSYIITSICATKSIEMQLHILFEPIVPYVGSIYKDN